MPVCGDCCGGSHGLATLAYQHHRLLGRHHTGCSGCRDLADRVTGTDADLAEGVRRMREEAEQ